jgi:hypothetical protein
MQQVRHFLRQAKAARKLAASADSEVTRAQLEAIAEAWERLANQRLASLEARSSAVGDAIRNASLKPENSPDRS